MIDTKLNSGKLVSAIPVSHSQNGNQNISSGSKQNSDQPPAFQPFPATSFEHYLYADDRIDLPMTFFLRLNFSGVLDLKKFEKALLDALPEQLLFQSLLNNNSSSSGKHLQWVPLPGTQLPYLDLAPIGTPFNWPRTGRYINLREEIGLRIFIRTDKNKSILTLQIHHSSSDAIGALEFIEEVMKRYHSTGDALKTISHHKLADREKIHFTAKEKFSRTGRDLGRAVKFFSKSPRPLASRNTSEDLPHPGNSGSLCSKVVFFGSSDFLRLKEYTKTHQITLNDLLLTELFISIDHFTAYGKKDRDCFRISMPINMRDSSHTECPSANIVSMCFLDRVRSSTRDETKLLQGIADETRAIKKYRLGLALIRTTKRFSRFTGGMDFLVKPRKPLLCYATTVLSNLGNVFDDSNVFDTPLSPALETVELLPPLRPHTHATIGVASFKENLSMAMHYNDLKISVEEAETFMDFLKSRLLDRLR